MRLDEDSIVAAALHDRIEDTAITHEDIARQFGGEVADIVEGVTKLTRVQFTSREDEADGKPPQNAHGDGEGHPRHPHQDRRQAAQYAHDGIHGRAEAARKSLETMEIYAPIAHRLGLQKVKWELEDPRSNISTLDGYREIITYLDSKGGRAQRVHVPMSKRRSPTGSRVQHPRNGAEPHPIPTAFAERCIRKARLDEIFLLRVPSSWTIFPDCYNVLGHIHFYMFRPCRAARDYIATPHHHGYQSEHTTGPRRGHHVPRCRSAPGDVPHQLITASPRTGSTNSGGAGIPRRR